MSEAFTALHISDVHHSVLDGFRQAPVLQAFVQDLSSQYIRGKKIDLIFFSGDLVQNPDEHDAYINLIELFDSLSKNTGVPESNILFCPGNHDISFKYLAANTLGYQSVQKNASNAVEFERLYLDGKLTEYALSANASFFSFCKICNFDWENPFFKVIDFPQYNMTAIALKA